MKKNNEEKVAYEYQSRRKYKLKQLIIILIICISCLSILTIFARYVVSNANDFFLRSKEFYFYSDKLKEGSAYYEIDNWSGVDDYMITVNMNSNDNNLKSTNYDIAYEVSYTCSSNIICQLSKNEGTISAKTNTDYFNLTITPNTSLNKGDRVSVRIKAVSKAEYTKTLVADFVLVVGKEDLTYEIVDKANNPYLELNLTNTLSYYTISTAFDSYKQGDRIDRDTYEVLSDENKKKCYSTLVTIKFDPSQILLDMTNTNYLKATNVTKTSVNGQEYISQMTFNIEALSSAMVRFYKLDVSKDYTYPITNDKPIVTVTNI